MPPAVSTEKQPASASKPAIPLPTDCIAHALLWEPRWLDRSTGLEHLPFLSWLVQVGQPNQLVGLGIGKATTYFGLCQSRNMAEGAQFFGIDSWSPEEDRPPHVPAPLAAHNAEQYASFSRLICSDPSRAAEFFDLGGVDFLLVEQPLSTKLLRRVQVEWMAQMSVQGVVAIADTGKASDPAIVAQLDALRKSHPHISFPHGGGMLILFPGATQPAPIMHLLARLKDKDESRIWRQQFKAIGRALSRRVKLAEREAELERLRPRLEQERTQRRDGLAQIKRLEQALQTERDALRQLGDDSRNALAAKEGELAAAQLALETVRGDRASQEDMAEASNQAAELRALAEQCDHLMAALATAQTSVVEMEAQYARAQAEILRQNEALKQAAAERLDMLDTYRSQRQGHIEFGVSQPT